MKAKYLLLLSILLTLSMLFGLIPVSAADNEKDSNIVSEKTAWAVAQYYVDGYSKTIPAWTGGTVNNPVAYYSDDETMSAYEFTVIKNGQEVGFIVISARKDWMPVLEFGDGSAPSSYLAKAEKAAKTKNYINQDEKYTPKYYYSGAASYAVQIGEKMKNDGKLIGLVDNKVRQKQDKVELKMDKQIAKNTWDKLLEGFMTGPSPTQLIQNSSMESGNPPNNWALEGTGAAYSQSTDIPPIPDGIHSLKLERHGFNCAAYQAISIPNEYIPGQKLKLWAWVWADQVDCVAISISDGITTPVPIEYQDQPNQWQLIGVELTIAQSATTLVAKLEIRNTNTTAYFDDVTLSVPEYVTCPQ
jgi:hypothetical protein